VEVVVVEALGDVSLVDARRLELVKVHDKLMRTGAVLA